MSHIMTANAGFMNPSKSATQALLESYVSALDLSIFESSQTASFARVTKVHTSEQVFEHQMFLLENINDVPDILRREYWLTRLGYDTISLRSDGEYLMEALALTEENFLTKVVDFAKSLGPAEHPTLNLLRFVLDIIGLVPFTWVGVPIDMVSNVLSAIISLYEGEWLSAILSILMTLDVTHASNIVAMTVKPALPVLEPFFKILFREGKTAFELEKGIVNMKDGLIKLGGRSMVENVKLMFTSLAKFFGGAALSIVKTLGSFLDKTFSVVGGKPKAITSLIDSIALKMTNLGKDIEKTTASLGSAAASTAEIDAKKAAASAAATAHIDVSAASKQAAIDAETAAIKTKHAQAGTLGQKVMYDEIDQAVKRIESEFVSREAARKAIADPIEKAIEDSIKGGPDLIKTIHGELAASPVYKSLLEKEKAGKIAKGWSDAWLKKSTENRLVGQPNIIMNAVETLIEKDPAIAAKYAAEFGYKPTGKRFLELSRAGDSATIKKNIDFVLDNPEVRVLLGDREAKALEVFKNNPDALVQGMKHFDEITEAILDIGKRAQSKGFSMLPNRRRALKRIVALVTKLAWEKYGSVECAFKALQNTSDTVKNTAALAKMAVGVAQAGSDVQATPVQEAEKTEQNAWLAAVGKTQQDLDQLKQTDPEAYSEVKSEADKAQAAKTTTKQTIKKDCSGNAAVVNSMIGMKSAGAMPYASGSTLGATPYNYDPKTQDVYTKNQMEILDKLGLGKSIDVQHALDNADPVSRVYFADVFNYTNGQIEVDPKLEISKRREVLQEMIQKGQVTQEEAQKIMASINDAERNNTEPAEVTAFMNRVLGAESVKESKIKVGRLFNK